MQSSVLPPPTAEPEVLRLSPSARRRRMAAVLVVLGLLLAGTVWGDDDEFPFGPFRMYSTRNDPNTPVISTRAVGVTAAGEEVRLSGGQVGLRRAEFEGQIGRLREHPELLGLLAEAYLEANPSAPDLVSVQVIHRKFGLSGGRPTGEYTDTVVVEHELADDE
ncbi:hypothetical protein [Blastococcus sp. CCUG 61487]|uniref:hypothetical protein n=1 Tax=Blastococcus sp. CCUG 61487 TaxID=1840703 RepID=UPI0010C0359C|nr:hypothetical protein [Blastococcus sp. CCUG 61487]TKJ18644.1 hypothetical protein A6V29_11295 [Blastococcus sp. CCUG 61487]